jgi:hypothetical protein
MTKQECAVLVGMIASAYPSWKPTQETVAVYVELLVDLDGNEAQSALRSLLMASEYPPSVATIRKKVLEQMDGLPLTKTEAWELVMSMVRRYGIAQRPNFEDEIVSQVVHAIGYRELCMSTNTDTIRAQFFRLYEEQAQKHLEEKLSSISFQTQIEGSRAKEIEA